MKNDPLDWEKVLAFLEAKENKKIDELSEEEANLLLFAEEVRQKLRNDKAEEQFPLSEGMQEFARRKNRRILRKFVTYAAVLLAFISVGILVMIFNKDTQPVEKTASNNQAKEIKLRLANGKEILIDSQTEHLNEQGSDIRITNDLINYTGKTDENTVDNEEFINSLEVPPGRRTKVVLADGTQVWLNSGTSLKYPVVFKGDKREISLEGEAYFDVAHNPAKPFIVHSGDLTVRVLGTAFGVRTFHGEIKTALIRGSVELKAKHQVQKLSPGQVGQYNTQSTTLSLSDEEARGIVAWKDNMLYFDNVDLDEIAETLGRTYDYEFVFDNPALKKLSFTIDLQRTTDIETVLDYLKMSLQTVDFKVSGRMIHVIDKK